MFRHVPALDGFRAIAVLIVMVSHAGLGKWIPGGFGVTIFFFLSGYLIISLMRSEQASTGCVSLKGFYFRRTIRIFPPMYITIGLSAAAALAGLLPEPVSAMGLLRDALFLTNYSNLWQTGPGVPIPLWSIDVEEWFYILFSLSFVLFLSRLQPARAARWCALACLFILCVRTGIATGGGNLDQIYYWSHTRFDSILYGGCLALWQNPRLDGPGAWRPRPWHIAFALAVLAACIIIRNPVFRETLRYSLQGMGLFVIFSAVLHDKGLVSRVMGSRPLRWVGLLSYTLYLCHVPILKMIEHNWPGLPLAATGTAMMVASAAYALAMYFGVERPLARWRSRRSARLRGISEPAFA